jgi:peroxiredoxin
MPSMERLREKLSDIPFEILAIDMAEEQADVASFLQRHKIAVSFPILLDLEGEVLEQWMVSAVPTTFIIDPKGAIRYALYGGLEWDSEEVVSLLRELAGSR